MWAAMTGGLKRYFRMGYGDCSCLLVGDSRHGREAMYGLWDVGLRSMTLSEFK